MSMVDDDQQAIPDNTPQPPISTDNSQPDSQPAAQPQPAAPAQPDPNASPTSGLLQDAQSSPLNKGIKGIVAYLSGAGAAPQDQVSDDGDKNLQMVEEAAKKGGPAAAWAMVQANRQAYNAKQAFAYTALNGIDGKAGHIAAAADAATKAGAHILDGSTVAFHPEGAGVTATVSGAGPTQKIKLTPEQFNQYLDVGGDGQYDKVLENGGAPTVLQQIARGPGKPLNPTAAPTPQEGDAPQANPTPGGRANNPAVAAGHAIVSDPTNANQPALPGTYDKDGHYIGAPIPDKNNYGEELEARSRSIYPGASQEAERQQWMQQQESAETERQNKVDVAKGGFAAKEKIADIQSGARKYSADQGREGKVQTQQVRSAGNQAIETSRSADRAAKLRNQSILQANRLAATSSNNDVRNRLQAFRSELTNPNKMLMTEDQVNQTAQKYGVDKLLGMSIGQAPQAPTSVAAPQQAAPQAPSQPAAASTPSQPSAGSVTVKSKAEYDRLPSGTSFTGPDGKKWKKP